MNGFKQEITFEHELYSLTLLTKEDKRIGQIGWHIFPGGKVLEIHIIWVEPEFQRKGYGTILVQKMIENYPDYKSVYLHSMATNTKANSFYSHLGFKKVLEYKDFYSDGRDAIFFIKRLKD